MFFLIFKMLNEFKNQYNIEIINILNKLKI